MRIDPHTHSCVSDGTDTPTELMHAAAQAGLDMVGLTDHDTFAGWEEAQTAVNASGVALLRGVEFSAAVDGITVHMLGYLLDPNDDRLVGICRQQRSERESRARRIVENLSADYAITWAEVEKLAPKDGPVGRPHIADAMVARGHFPDRSTVFEWALHPRGPYYVFQESVDARDLVEYIRGAGGVPVLAHPRASQRQRLISDDVIEQMAKRGLFGIERDHRDHNDEQRGEIDVLAHRLDLQIFGSSDYHGRGKPNRLAENLTDESVIVEMSKQGQLEILYPWM